MHPQEIIELIKRELPRVIKTDTAIQELVLNLSRHEFAPKQQTEGRFEKMLAQLVEMRQESERKWAEAKAEDRRKWEEAKAEDQRKWEEQNRKWEEAKATDQRKWDEHHDEHRREFDRMHEEIMAIAKKQESSIGALGVRWGMQSEQAFRNGLAAILEKTFGVEVINYLDYDDQGYVFGHPDQVELDVIVQNGSLILCEIKSSLSRGEVYLFKRKAEFYEAKHNRQANRLLVISPMVDDRARHTAEKLGVELYTHSLDVKRFSV